MKHVGCHDLPQSDAAHCLFSMQQHKITLIHRLNITVTYFLLMCEGTSHKNMLIYSLSIAHGDTRPACAEVCSITHKLFLMRSVLIKVYDYYLPTIVRC